MGREGAACGMGQEVCVDTQSSSKAGESSGVQDPNCTRPGLPTGSISMSNCENLIKVLSQFGNRRET